MIVSVGECVLEGLIGRIGAVIIGRGGGGLRG